MSTRYLKQVIVVRKDLCMPGGKMAAMVAHAAMTFILSRLIQPTRLPDGRFNAEFAVNADEWRWLTELDPGIEDTGQVSMAKIVLQVPDEAALVAVERKAEQAGLTVHRVIDSGCSHNKTGTLVCVAIGPHWPEMIDPITAGLKPR